GISSLVPGDIFKVDYLPERQRKRLYFQVTKVTHNVSSTTWTTQLETVPRIRPSDKFKSGLYNKPSDIVISQKIFNQLGIKSLNKHPAYMSGLKVTHLTNDMKSVVDESSNLIVDKVFTFVAKKDAVETVQLPLVSSGYRKSKHKRARQHTTRTPVYDSFKNMTEFNISSISGKLTDTGKKAEGSLSQDWTYYKYTYEVDYKSRNMYRLILFKNSIVGPNGVELNWMIFPNTSSSTDVETGLKLWQRIVMVNSSVRTMALTVETDLAALIHEEKGGDVKYDVRCNVCETLDEASCTNDENSQFCEWYEPWTWTNYCKQKDCCDETRSSNIGYDGEYIYACGS
ncbi:MAG: hypothetical protein H8D94_01405, partial [Candidatus Pelagibacter sp.]|nr:hypothetical protein [Candidatus Pelagibacter sp.]